MIRPLTPQDHPALLEIINDAAGAYKGVIPEDRWHEPYFSPADLAQALGEGVEFHGLEAAGALQGVMGVQDRGDVALIRHAYVRTALRGRGVGGQLLTWLTARQTRPVLIGTWAAADWAIRFYQKHGFKLVDGEAKDALLRKYWNIPQRQVETSVVLTNSAI